MGGKPCIRGMRITVGTIAGLFAAGRSREEILQLYPYLEMEDISAALSYACWLSEAFDAELQPAWKSWLMSTFLQIEWPFFGRTESNPSTGQWSARVMLKTPLYFLMHMKMNLLSLRMISILGLCWHRPNLADRAWFKQEFKIPAPMLSVFYFCNCLDNFKFLYWMGQ